MPDAWSAVGSLLELSSIDTGTPEPSWGLSIGGVFIQKGTSARSYAQSLLLPQAKAASANKHCGTVTKLVHVSGTCHTLECALRVHERMGNDCGGHRPMCVCPSLWWGDLTIPSNNPAAFWKCGVDRIKGRGLPRTSALCPGQDLVC